MVKTLASVLLIASLPLSFNAQAGGNPGRSAMQCVSTSSHGNRIQFRNTCNQKIFVIWCGDLKYTKKRCGDGPRGNYFTHSHNIRPGDSTEIVLRNGGSYRYGACVGGVGFGTDEFTSSYGGRFSCKPTGSYARKNRY